MPPSINRIAIVFDVAAFLGIVVLCIGTQAPQIQRDILKRCQDALSLRQISVRGISVDGRDVIVTANSDSQILNVRTQRMLEGLPGVRSVRIRSGRGDLPTPLVNPAEAEANLDPGLLAARNELQSQIDQVLAKQGISFKTGTAVLTPESSSPLDQIVSILNKQPALTCEIRAYDRTSRDSPDAWNLALQRALATAEYLEGRGVAEWRLSSHVFQIGAATAGRPSDRLIDLLVRAR